MKRRRFVVLDRDGTIIGERHYLSDPKDVELLPGVVPGLRRLIGLELGLVILTNQSGIGRKFFDEGRLNVIHGRLRDILSLNGIEVDGIYYCPHVPEESCDCRKPNPGLLRLAAKDLGFEPHVSFVIGDKSCDIGLGRAVGATTFLVRTGYGSTFAADPAVAADYIVDNLADAATVIERLLTCESKAASIQKEHSGR
jgi:D-glycero-D-manno-heptose 1,7-bisphosphate phosphatase